jgi:divalent metal cation (Fe/Co/Zn/Cd) transporter
MRNERLWNYAFALAIFTIVFNVVEGIVSIYFGLKDETLTLFGFGSDSFIEVISAIGVAVMIIRIRKNPGTEKSRFEIVALKITGWCFYALSLILLAGIIINLVEGSKPESTLPGIIISSISIISMIGLIVAKKKLGKMLDSPPLIADANCNLVCVYMSIVLLVSSTAYEIFNFGFIDILGTAGIIYFSVKEGIESFEKAKGLECSCHTGGGEECGSDS